MRRLQLYDSTAIEQPFDAVRLLISTVIRVTVTQPASRSHSDLLIYLRRRAVRQPTDTRKLRSVATQSAEWS